jgi:hypothetical protein
LGPNKNQHRLVQLLIWAVSKFVDAARISKHGSGSFFTSFSNPGTSNHKGMGMGRDGRGVAEQGWMMRQSRQSDSLTGLAQAMDDCWWNTREDRLSTSHGRAEEYLVMLHEAWLLLQRPQLKLGRLPKCTDEGGFDLTR